MKSSNWNHLAGLTMAGMLAFSPALQGVAQSAQNSVPAAQRTVTSLAAETANNTGAADNFPGTISGAPKPANISPLMLSSMLPTGDKTRYISHLMPNFSTSCGPGAPHCNGHITVGYESADDNEIAKQLTDMQRRGFSVVWLDWFGLAIPHHDVVAQKMMKEAERIQASGALFNFIIQPDHGIVKGCDEKDSQCNTAKLLDALTYAYKTYETSPAYLRWKGRPVVPFFWSRYTAVDWDQLKHKVPGNPLFVYLQDVGFSEVDSDGAFSWSSNTGPKDPAGDFTGLAYLDHFYQVAAQNKDKIVIGSAYAGYDDRLAGWAKDKKVIPQKCGVTWLETMRESLKYQQYSGQPLPFLQVVTWNDYEEGSAVEPGVDNCVTAVTAQAADGKLTWNVQFGQDKDGATGNEVTIAYYRVLLSTGNGGLQEVKRVLYKQAHEVDLASLNLHSGQTVYVEAVGQAMIQNHLSAPVSIP